MGALVRWWSDPVARGVASTYLAVFLATGAWATWDVLTWQGPEASMAAVIPIALASPTASGAVAVLTITAEQVPALGVLASTPVLAAAITASALLQAVVLGLVVASARGRGDRSPRRP